eukprot:SAG22_NODE_205_length_15308_cov_20.539023_4_plen_71_part_00
MCSIMDVFSLAHLQEVVAAGRGQRVDRHGAVDAEAGDQQLLGLTARDLVVTAAVGRLALCCWEQTDNQTK